MEFKPPPPEPPEPRNMKLRVVVPWEIGLSLSGLVVCAIFAALGLLGWAGGWVGFWAPASLIIGLQLHLIFICYRLCSYMFALILEVSPVIANMSKVLQGVMQGRTTE